MRISLEGASATQLARAAAQLGIEVDHRKGRDHILTLLATSGYDKDYIEFEDPVTPLEPSLSKKRVKIMISTQHGPGGKDPVVGGVNGKNFRIQRGVVVEVSDDQCHVLQNANQIMYEKGPNNEPINPTLVPRFPIQILG